MHLHHCLPPSSFLLGLLWLQAGQTSAMYRPGGGVAPPDPGPPVKTLAIGHDTFVVNPTNIVIHHTTIAPNAAPITVDGVAVFVDKSFDVFLDGSLLISGPDAHFQKTSYVVPLSSPGTHGTTHPSVTVSKRETASSTFSSSDLGGSFRSSRGRNAPTIQSSSDPSATFQRSGGGIQNGSGPTHPVQPSGSVSASRSTPNDSSKPPGSGTSRVDTPNGLSQFGSGSVGGNMPSSSPTLDSGTSSSDLPSKPGTDSKSSSQSLPIAQGSVLRNSSLLFKSSSQSREPPTLASSTRPIKGTPSITSATTNIPLPGSTGRASSVRTTSAAAPSMPTSGGPSSQVITPVPTTTAAGGIPLMSIPASGSAVSSQDSELGAILFGFVSGGRSWANDITLPAAKTLAIHEIENMLHNTENVIKNLGGVFPPTTDLCSGSGKRKRFFNPLGTVISLAHDALGLANCIGNIVSDISKSIGPLVGPPPGPGIIPGINVQLNALAQAAQEEQNKGQSTTTTSTTTSSDSTGSSISPSSKPSSTTSSSSSSRSSSSSSAPAACATYVYPQDDITQWEGAPNKRSFLRDDPDYRHHLSKRASLPLNAINSCNFPPNMLAVQPTYSELKGFINLGKNPNGNGGAAGQVYNNAAKWYVGNHTCATDPGFKWFRTASQAWNGIPAYSRQSVDHVCKSSAPYPWTVMYFDR